ncbi:protein O-mannose kinase-like [Oratosquilla oratoria]|uniref:protein O-mannose kinase-like n=1 Tax=Oratosquilla oratoria TaxID=337810 RepID=UPI003F7632B5
MSECHPLLGCSEMASLEIGAFIGSGAVKQVYRTEYKGLSIALVFVNNKAYTEDFLNGLTFLKNLGPLQNIVQLIGYCDSALVYLTEYHPNGNLKNLSNILASSAMVDLEKLFRLCIDYVHILKVLHDYPKGPVVMCDSSTLDKTLEQYLVTNEFRLVLNDLDSLHQVEGDGIVCGHKQLAGDFVAPEQLWPYEDKEYDEFQMPQYCEKVDIWKIPRVCNYILSFSRDRQWLEYHLFKIHKKCRERNPSLRPSATDVLEFYEKVYSDNFSKDNKLAREEL